MMRNRFAVPLLSLMLATPGFFTAPQPAFAATAYSQDRAWDDPPQEFKDIQRQGFHDGIEGARKDFDNHRRADVNNRDEYRHPHVPSSARANYREGFRRGYDTATQHLMNGPR